MVSVDMRSSDEALGKELCNEVFWVDGLEDQDYSSLLHKLSRLLHKLCQDYRANCQDYYTNCIKIAAQIVDDVGRRALL